MRSNYLKTLKTAVLAVTVLLLGASVCSAQQQVNLIAGPSNLILPDGSSVPMWGYSCGAAVLNSTATCANLNTPAAPASAQAGWSPVIITVPTGQALQINLTNNLTFPGANIPTSLTIVGQVGGGLGTVGAGCTGGTSCTDSPDHTNAQSVTWPIVDSTTTGNPPPQAKRVQSFGSEVPGGGGTASLTWNSLRQGTYLLESGTHPSIQGPMGLYGIVVVTTAPVGATPGTAYPGVNYSADIPFLFSELDPVQNNAVQAAVNTAGFSETKVWSGQPGQCGNPASGPGVYQTCYPPAVNYTPLYYMINGVAFDKTNAARSLFAATPSTGVSGNLLVRVVNAGLRMHVPSIVGAQTGANNAAGFALVAEDGNPLPGLPRVQSEVFMAAGKTYDLMINAPTSATAAPIYDRELSLSGNATSRDAGMLAYIGVNNATVPAAASLSAAVANNDNYNALIAGQTFTVSDPGKGVLANDVNVYGVQLIGTPTGGTVTLNTDGTFTFAATASSGSFQYCGNGTTVGPACASVTLGAAAVEAASGIVMNNIQYNSNVASTLSIKPPGILSVDKDNAGYSLKVAAGTVTPTEAALNVTVDPDGGFNATVSSPGTYHFTYKAQNSQGTQSASTATVTLVFPTANGPTVHLIDGATKAEVTPRDFRWIIEEDRTFYIDPNNTTNTGAPGSTNVLTYGTNFHTSYMPVVATGCVGTLSCESGQTMVDANGNHVPAVCDAGNGVCRTTGTQFIAVDPSQVHLDPTKRYYISVLPGDGADALDVNPQGHAHGMGGAPIVAGQTVNVIVEPTPLQTSKLSVFVFEDDFPLNGENDAGGGIDVLSPNEPGLGGFEITLFDDAGGTGDATGQMTYDMFNMPLANALSGTIDPSTGLDACPISPGARKGIDVNSGTNGADSPTGITGTIVTCPAFESDGVTDSPLRGQAVVANLMPGRYGVVATPAADRIARGEEWLQTNTLDGQKAHDSFLRVGEPSYFQEFGPAGYHVSIGFANPAVINSRLAAVCAGTDINVQASDCTHTVSGKVTTERMSRTPDERLYSSGSNDGFAFTQCYVSIGDTDGEDFAFTKCNADGTFSLSGIPAGNWKVSVFDQWNDMLVDGLSTPVGLGGNFGVCPGPGSSASVCNLGDVATNQWQANIYTQTFFDQNYNGIRDAGENGLSLVATNIRFRDGSFSNFNSTDLAGNAGFNEVFPLFAWYVIETDSTRYKTTGTHVVYDAGGPTDGSTSCGPTGGFPPCGSASGYQFMANTNEPAAVALPANLRVPGSVYCSNADCTGFSVANGPGSSQPGSTGRIDPAWVNSYGWQGFSGQNSFLDFGKKPFAPTENGGIHGHVIYASTRPFDDPSLLLQLSWEPGVPNVTINLYQEGTDAGGAPTLKLVDTTKTTSWDDWAQGFRSDGVPNMNCPGQTTTDLFYFSLFNQPEYLDVYNGQHANPPVGPHAMPNNSQFKCYDGMHNWNQLQPAPYDGMYSFPSVTGINPTTGKPTGTNCTICISNPSTTNPADPNYDPYRAGAPMLPPGKYVVEVVVPPGYELVKEEDKNILIGDTYIAPATQQFAGLGNIFIMPDQAAIASSYNANNAQNQTTNLGAGPRHEGDTGSIESFWPCVGAARVVPDFISLFPESQEVSPFAGATRNLCDRKEVTLDNQTSALAKFYIFTSTHAAAHFTGIITDDFTSEFDPFSPQFGEKFSPPDLPISIKDFNGNEIARTYSDHWGFFDGLNYSTWEVNPPNPTGYAPTMMVVCMNDPGPIQSSNGTMITDPLYNVNYSQFCYEIPFMPGQTQYMDTPVVPTAAFAGAGYNNPDCAYPDATPAIGEVDGDGVGPWISSGGSRTLTIYTINGKNPVGGVTPGDVMVNNYGYAGPSATAAPFNQKKVLRHYGFGGTKGTVSIGGTNIPAANITTWTDTQIVLNVPAGFTPAVSACPIQQQAVYGGSAALCGQLVIKAANGKQSIDAITVTIGGKAPHVLGAGETIQQAIDSAHPGDLIIVPAGTYYEMVLMWKPVRLQGVGAASSVINANPHPAGKLDPWRQEVVCLFGIAPNGSPATSGTPTTTFNCGNGLADFVGNPTNPQVDRLPLEATVGWDATLNGNLAELLQEPTLMGAYEGAGITVLAKGVRFPRGSSPFAADVFPAGTALLTNNNTSCGNGINNNPFPSNFWCNPSSIDGLGVTDSSQGGGGIFVHGWAHNIQIANNRVNSNTGTLSGGISVGQGEFPPQYLQGGIANEVPGSCYAALNPQLRNSMFPSSIDPVTTNTQLPFCFNLNVNVHNNNVTSNNTLGDELFSATPSGAGGVAFCTGADNYKFNNNWVCGNLSTGDGGGVIHVGFSYNGDIEHNAILFNESTNPTIPTNGGGIAILGAPDTDPICGTAPDGDCPPGTSDGTGPHLVINANLIMGNAAESGSGGGIRFQGLNGSELTFFPDGRAVTSGPPAFQHPSRWYSADVTNNIIVNNVAGWDGAGISLQDALQVNLVNNTIMSNDTTASSGVLFNTLGAPIASSTGPTCTANCGTASAPQPAGLVSIQNSPTLTADIAPLQIRCPNGHFQPGTPQTNGTCKRLSYPVIANDVFWQNRDFHISVGGLGGGNQNQQNVVTLLPTLNQSSTGACVTTNNYWDLGVRGDTGPGNHSNPTSTSLSPTFSILTSTSEVGVGTNDRAGSSNNPAVVSQYCNGSRIPPEFGGTGYQVPPGISDATVPNPLFNLTPAATVDEGNNWVNISWGPLALTNPVTNTTLGDYSLTSASRAINAATPENATYPTTATDYFGTLRPQGGAWDIGAVEFAGAGPAPATVTIAPNPLTITLPARTITGTGTVTFTNTAPLGGSSVTITSVAVDAPGSGLFTWSLVIDPLGSNANTCTGATLSPGQSCTVRIRFSSLTATRGVDRTGTITFTDNASGSPQVGQLVGHAN